MRHATRVFGLAAAIVFAGALGATGCGSTESDICGMKCDCEGCSNAQYQNCLDNYDADLRAADYRNCLPFYDDWVGCQQATSYCKGGKDWETSCGNERSRFNACVN